MSKTTPVYVNYEYIAKLAKNKDDVDKINSEIHEYYIICTNPLKNKSMTLICNSSMSRISFEDDLVDYGSSWLWIGCANNRWNVDGSLWRNYIGKIKRIGVFNKSLSKKEINKFLENYEKKDNETTNPFFITTKFCNNRKSV